MGIRPAQFLLILLIGWTAVGICGVLLSLLREQHVKAFKNVSWIAGIWVGYFAILLCTSFLQKPKLLAVGVPQCFNDLCYTVVGTETVPGYLTTDSHLLRVLINVSNRSHEPLQENHLHPFLVDATGRRWNEVPGLSGIPLSVRVQPGQALISAPVFKLPREVTPLGLGFVHSNPYFGLLVIGDSESLFHQRIVARLTP